MNRKLMFSNVNNAWCTPQDFFDKLNAEFDFTLDPCATAKNHKCENYFTRADDGLTKNWGGQIVFMNPPYGREIGKWVEKISREGGVALLPARTDTRWFHDYIYGKAEIRFLRGRLKFGGSSNSAPFPSMVCVFKRKEPAIGVCLKMSPTIPQMRRKREQDDDRKSSY